MQNRQLTRMKKRIKVRFGIDYPKRVAFTGDLTIHGLYIITGQPERPGSSLIIEMDLPDQEGKVVAHGRVRWAKKVPPNLMQVADKAGMGVQLIRYDCGEDFFRKFIETLHR